MLLALAALLGASGLASGSETALFRLAHADRQRLAREHPTAARAVEVLFREPRALLVTVLLCNMTANVTYFVVSSVLSYRVDGPVAAAAVGVGTLLTIILFGEVLAKLLASAHRVAFVSVMAVPLLTVHRVIGPVRFVVDRLLVGPLSRLVAPPERRAPQSLSPEELSALLDIGAHSGAIDADEQELLADVLELGALRVRDIMTPAIDVRTIPAGATRAQVLEAVRETHHTRYPITTGGLDGQVHGILNARNYLAACETAPQPPRLESFVDSPRYVPEMARLDQLLEHFRRTHTRAGLAVDERGAVTGWVQLERVVEELVVLASEASPTEMEQIRLVGLSTWIVPGRLPVHEWGDLFPAPLPKLPRVSTLAGLITATLGRIPAPGDAIDMGNVHLEVDAMQGRVIERVRVTLTEAPPGGQP